MRRLFSSTSLTTCLFAGLLAASAGGAAYAADSVAVEEIIVTAQKRAENIQDVPQAVQVVSSSQLAASGVREFTDLTKLAPSLVVRPAEQPVNSSVSIRGVGTFAFSIGVEPSVAIQVDDVPVAFQARAFTDLSDIEHIEVLRGPQSTLYGKSASAGLINIVTRAPTAAFSGTMNALATTDDEYSVGGAISGPITDQLLFRVAANYDDFAGNARNVFNDKKASGREFISLHGKLVWTPTDKLTASVGWNYVDGETTVGRPFIALAPNATLRGNPLYPPSVFQAGINVGPNNTRFANNFNARTDYEDNSQSLKLEYDLGPATLVSVTGNDNYNVTDLLDVDETAVALDNRSMGDFKSGQFTQEVRIVSNGDSALRYTAGVYYADIDFIRNFGRGPVFSQARWYATSASKQYAGFGQLDWEFSPGTTITGGIRRQHEKIDYSFLDILNGGAFFSGGAKDNFWTWRAALNHKFSEDVMGYLSYATGHKGQTYDLTTGFNRNRQLAGPVRPETSRGFEGGVRSTLFDGRLTLNVTAFRTKYKDFQAQGIETLPDGTVNFRLANVGKLRTQGIEVDSALRVNDDLRISASAAYLDAKITDFPLAQCYPLQTVAQGCVTTPAPSHQDLSGHRPAQSPKFKLSADATYSHPIAGTPWVGVGIASFAYQSKMNFALSGDPQTIQKGYGVLNLTAGIRDPERHYEIMAFVNNVFDKQYYGNIFNQTSTYNSQTAVQVILPRDFKRFAGIRGSYSF